MTCLLSVIRQARLAAGLSQSQVAAHLGVRRLRVTDWESGRVNLKAEDLISLAILLDLDLNALKEQTMNEIIPPSDALYGVWNSETQSW